VIPKSDSNSESDENDNIKQFGPISTKNHAFTKHYIEDINVIFKLWFDELEVTGGLDPKADTIVAVYHKYLFPEILEFQNINSSHLLGMTKHISTEHMMGYKENLGMLGCDNNR